MGLNLVGFHGYGAFITRVQHCILGKKRKFLVLGDLGLGHPSTLNLGDVWA